MRVMQPITALYFTPIIRIRKIRQMTVQTTVPDPSQFRVHGYDLMTQRQSFHANWFKGL